MAFVSNVNSSECPCCGCKDRKPGTGCHDRCEQYLKWKKDLTERNKSVHLRNVNYMSDQKQRAIWRSQRYSRRKTYNIEDKNNS